MNTERYRPTKEDIQRVRPQKDKLKISGDGVFATLQGEGITAGLPSVFLRLHYCNLTCGVPSGWQCDTGYTWDRTKPEFWKEPKDWSYKETASYIRRAWGENFENKGERRLVITGGEPLIQQTKITKLLEHLRDWEIEIETNGTIVPLAEIQTCQFNCSPKLENSGNPLKRRYKPEVLKAINSLPKSQFKFVVAEPSDLDEVEKIASECSLNPEKILIMPEGQTVEQVELHANKVREAVVTKGWRITMRNQILWYGSRRRT